MHHFREVGTFGSRFDAVECIGNSRSFRIAIDEIGVYRYLRAPNLEETYLGLRRILSPKRMKLLRRAR